MKTEPWHVHTVHYSIGRQQGHGPTPIDGEPREIITLRADHYRQTWGEYSPNVPGRAEVGILLRQRSSYPPVFRVVLGVKAASGPTVYGYIHRVHLTREGRLEIDGGEQDRIATMLTESMWEALETWNGSRWVSKMISGRWDESRGAWVAP